MRLGWRRLSLRSRLLLLGTGGLVAGFAISGLVLVTALGFALQRNVDADAMSTANGVAALVQVHSLPEPVPVSGEQIVQVVDEENRIVSASINADRLNSLLRPAELASARAGRPRYVNGARTGYDGQLRVVAVPVGKDTVIVARPVWTVNESIGVVRIALSITYPLLIVALVLVARRVVGAALRPVEALRVGAENITGAGRDDRLPVPESQDEIQRLAVTLNGMLDRLATARARQRAFVADAAHELRSPLTNMRTELEVAQRLGDQPDAENLLADVERLSRLVDDLLLLARADDAPGLARTEPVDVASLVRSVAERYDAARVPVVVVDGPDGWTEGDPQALEHVVANLVDNAVRHAASRVTVSVSRAPGHVVVAVSDDGPGIAATERERVFERFTRLDDARARDAGGAGLGLAIVRELVRRHGGTATLSDAAPGLRAEVILPALSHEHMLTVSP
jgi:signal transduction histidine kinase